METTISPMIDFWQLPSVTAQLLQLQQRMGTVVHGSSSEPWMILQAGVIRSIIDEDIRRRDSHLTLFASLTRQFRTHVETHFGSGCWEQVEKTWGEINHGRAVFLQFLKQLSVADGRDALVALIELRHEGLTYRLPGGRSIQCTPFDHGIEELATLMQKMERFLSDQPVNDPTVTSDNYTADPTRQLVIIKLIGGKQMEVRFGGNCCPLKGQECTFLLLLKGQPSAVADEELFEHICPGDTYVPDGKGPPENIRTIKSKADRQLIKKLGKPPNGEHWICRTQGFGYGLFRNNGSLVWAFAKEGREKNRDRLFS